MSENNEPKVSVVEVPEDDSDITLVVNLLQRMLGEKKHPPKQDPQRAWTLEEMISEFAKHLEGRGDVFMGAMIDYGTPAERALQAVHAAFNHAAGMAEASLLKRSILTEEEVTKVRAESVAQGRKHMQFHQDFPGKPCSDDAHVPGRDIERKTEEG